ncbi:DNA gyrase inhibitor YacG [Marinimicrobium sp. ARAG 43.8]|uniref:DNA gyrase inhibitor YacG n=1 Tax=Marinimicrobium sp. ARAG 43.8 TaxID=3418719 RepID=UPI003CFAF95C
MTEHTAEPITLNCPTCGKTVRWTDAFPYRPFCSERCKLIDLGEWASENHKIPGEPVIPDPEDDSGY